MDRRDRHPPAPRASLAVASACSIAAAAALALAGCGRPDAPAGAAAPDPLAPLHAFEEERRRATDFAHLPASSGMLGADPIAVRALPGAGPARFVGLLRGRGAVVLLDASLHEIAREVAPGSPTGIAVEPSGRILVSAEDDGAVGRYRVDRGDALVRATETIALETRGIPDLASFDDGRGRVLYRLDARGEKLFAHAGGEPPPLSGSPRAPAFGKSVPTCAGAFRLAIAGSALVVDCLLDHTLLVFDLDRDGAPSATPRARIQHDGPMWSVAAAETKEGLLIAAGGVEDHPLDRTEGSFGYIDSFVFLYRLAPGATKAEKLAETNVSELGVITPKALLLHPDPAGGARVIVAGYGGDRLAELRFPAGFAAPAASTRAVPPGIASLAAAGEVLAAADPLLDAWVLIPPSGEPVVVPVPDPQAPPRSVDSRVGEALFFTRLMAPWNQTEGRLSRFTCETCHFEGTFDGRTHHTGRGDVHATTKTLRGLLNNRPYFSRALDPDMATMVNNEFRVAGAKSGHDPWFSAADTGLAWIPLLGVAPAELDAVRLRRALMTFLADFTHAPNDAAAGRQRFTDDERAGAGVFARRCERCHEARLVADDAASRVPPEQWEALVLSREGPIVWARDGYHKTGIEPYVHEQGARAPSLRRVYAKRPYFTNGSARSLRDVLARARWQGDAFWHDRAPEGAEGLGEEERRVVEAFLDLL
jgi:hypothetical protein